MEIYDKIHFFSVDDLKKKGIENCDIIPDLLRGYKVSVLTGGSKVGKTSIALDMANAISNGGKFLNFQCMKQQVLYISVDNDSDLIGERLSKMKISPNPNLKFYCDSVKLGVNGTENEDTVYLNDVVNKTLIEELPDLRVVFIDLYDNIREVNALNEYSNAIAQKEIELLKELATSNGIAFILLTHDSKANSKKGYNSAKGATEFIGTINGTYMHLIRNGIGETSATLEIGGRNVKETVLHITFNSEKVCFELDESDEMDTNIALIRNYMNLVGDFSGTASLLCTKAKLLVSAKSCGRLLVKYKDVLENEGIHIQFPTNHHNRIYHLVSDNYKEKI
ncbi:MAG: AAA family ATPase [Bacillota bacterium]|nr:AAA family ATPase [Bacillota bacterium]